MTQSAELDWRAAWLERGKQRRPADSSDYWDQRSLDFKEHSGISLYTDIFLDYLDLQPGWSVLDMGSGPGTLAILLAQRGHPVIAADFSVGMRRAAQERADKFGLSNVQVRALDWDEDWSAAGVAPKSVDVAVASRSTIVADLGDALQKLNATARQRVAITMVTEYSPRGFKPRGSQQEGSNHYIPDYIYGLNLLLQLGAYPELRYIDSHHASETDPTERLVRWAFISWVPFNPQTS